MNRYLLIIAVILLVGCKPQPREIDYGLDACSYCKMNIVDAQFAAQLVTKKGKIYTYDAIECLINDMESHPETTIAHRVIKDYGEPIEWIDATQAVFVRHPEIQSPMGGNLAGFATINNAQTVMNIPKDSLFSWEYIVNLDFEFDQ